jgi:hypothetical protein
VVTAMAVAAAGAACGTTLHRGTEAAAGDTGSAGPGATVADAGATVDGTIPADGTVAPGAGTATTAVASTRVPGAALGPVDRSPISLGFLLTEVGNAGAFGLDLGSAFTSRQVTEALVKAMNAKGGIAGRPIRSVLARTDTASVSWETDYAAACAAFTQDNEVTAVLGYSFAFFDSFESCLARSGVVHLSTMFNGTDDRNLPQYPLLYLVGTPSYDRYYRVAFQGAVGSGFMTPTNVLGVLRGGCSADRRAWEQTGAPLARQLKINVGLVEEVSCISGASGAGAAVTQIQSAVLRMRARGVDTVMVEGPPAIIFSSAAESQGWHPRYLVTSLSGGAALSGNIVPGQIVNFHGFGWLPSVDVLPPQQPARNAPQLRCLELLRSQGLNPTQQGDFTTAFQACDAIFLYEAALRATNGNSEPKAIAAAIDALGGTYQSAYTLGGLTRFGGRHDAPAQARPWSWSTGCSCFRYTASAYGI